MALSESFMATLTLTGKLSSFTLTLSPMPSFLLFSLSQEEKLKRLDSISYLYLLTGLIVCGVWTSYAYLTQNFDIGIINVFALVCISFYTTVYLVVKGQVEQLLQILILYPIGMCLFITLVPLNIIGSIGALFSIYNYLSPLENIPKVIKGRDRRYLNLPIATATCFNALIWCIYGYFIGDFYICISQLIGLQGGFIQITFYLWAAKVIESNIVVDNLLKLFLEFEKIQMRFSRYQPIPEAKDDEAEDQSQNGGEKPTNSTDLSQDNEQDVDESSKILKNSEKQSTNDETISDQSDQVSSASYLSVMTEKAGIYMKAVANRLRPKEKQNYHYEREAKSNLSPPDKRLSPRNNRDYFVIEKDESTKIIF